MIGTFCVYVPEELILAVEGTCVGLCAGADIGIDEAEKVLPRNTCALIKSFMGFKLAGLCPYIQASDLVVGETTCDGKKKAYEILNDYKETYVMEIPHMKTERDRTLWKEEVLYFKEKLEQVTGRKITPENLKKGIKIVKRVSTTKEIIFAGGVAKNPCLKYLLEEALGKKTTVPQDPQMLGAYGAALITQES